MSSYHLAHGKFICPRLNVRKHKRSENGSVCSVLLQYSAYHWHCFPQNRPSKLRSANNTTSYTGHPCPSPIQDCQAMPIKCFFLLVPQFFQEVKVRKVSDAFSWVFPNLIYTAVLITAYRGYPQLKESTALRRLIRELAFH